MKRSLLLKLFMLAFLLRLAASFVLSGSGMLFSGLSRDSRRYHSTGLEIAGLLENMSPDLIKSWVDDAWFLVIGYVYYYLAPEPLIIQVLNSLLGALAAVMTALMVWKAYQNLRVAFFAGWMIAVFPSFIYFNSMLLKDAASLFLMATLGWAVVSLRLKFKPRYLFAIMACLIGYLGIREYFFFIGAVLAVVSLLPFFGRSAVSIKSLIAMIVLFAGVSYWLGLGVFGSSFFADSEYFDLDYINATRERLDRGSGAIGGEAWGESITGSILNALTGLYYFIFSVNPLDIGSERQFFALPEMLALFLALPPLVRGISISWRQYRATAVVLIIFGVAVLAVYVSATTNAGALYRWRMQAFPFLFGILAIGLTAKRSRGNPLVKVMSLVTRRLEPRPNLRAAHHVR